MLYTWMGWDGMEISVSTSSKSSERHSAVLIKGAHYMMSNLNLAFEMYFLQILCYTFLDCEVWHGAGRKSVLTR